MESSGCNIDRKVINMDCKRGKTYIWKGLLRSLVDPPVGCRENAHLRFVCGCARSRNYPAPRI
eukprot:7822933-Pyramimonas_sp.AAC.1